MERQPFQPKEVQCRFCGLTYTTRVRFGTTVLWDESLNIWRAHAPLIKLKKEPEARGDEIHVE